MPEPDSADFESFSSGDSAGKSAGAAAHAMESAAEYLETHDFEEIVSDVKQLAKKHPGAVLLAAAAAGFLLARSLSRH